MKYRREKEVEERGVEGKKIKFYRRKKRNVIVVINIKEITKCDTKHG